MYNVFIGDDSKVDTPVPIPNTEVKHFNGEDSVSENSKLPIFFINGGIGEVINTPDCGSGMRGFDSHIPPHKKFIPVFTGFSYFYLLFTTYFSRFLLKLLMKSTGILIIFFL